MAKFAFLVHVFFVALLLVLSQAGPIKDESSTSVSIAEKQTSPTSERFIVAVQRIDDLVGDGGELLAERISAVVIKFDLNDEGLRMNDIAVPMNVTSVQVLQAEIVPANITQEQLQQYENSFDIGMVTVEVNTIAKSYPTEDPGFILRQIVIAVRIIEIDGVTVVQNDVVERIIEAKIVNTAAPVADEASDVNGAMTGSSTPCNLNTIFARIRHWWCCSSKITRVAIISLFLTSIFGILFMVIPASMQSVVKKNLGLRQPYQAISEQNDDDEDAKVEQVIFIADEEKRMLMEKEKEEGQK
ncbi:2095_t:CDS:2 [Dentiscutata erythropus]|uniref:2095_t:CDS:1 n=1 Tax=Dentiscutata erythropus TaxID=1348616 RepID=A0A9N9BUJ1_9GLOM|nr:2095_t:CDS:2 [Dentiscutata erythropus]